MDRRSMSCGVKEGQGLSLLYELYREFVTCIGMAKVNAAAIRSNLRGCPRPAALTHNSLAKRLILVF
jgi:hypothetical protein